MTIPPRSSAVNVNEINHLTNMTCLMLHVKPVISTTVRLLIQNGASVNAQDAMGNTALMYAVQKGSIETVKTLLEHGADISFMQQQRPNGEGSGEKQDQ